MIATQLGTSHGDSAAAVPAVASKAQTAHGCACQRAVTSKLCLAAVQASLSWAGQLINAY